jgi:hypothetical protein
MYFTIGTKLFQLPKLKLKIMWSNIRKEIVLGYGQKPSVKKRSMTGTT